MDGGSPNRHRAAGTAELVFDLVLVVVICWVLWVTSVELTQKMSAASGTGRPGVMLIEGLRHSRGGGIPVGTFTENDGTTTSGVAWQDRPAAIGDRLVGVRVGARAWPSGVHLGAGDAIVTAVILWLLGWRVLVLVRAWRGRGARGGGPVE